MTVAPHPTLAPQPGILDIAPYVGGETGAAGASIKLSSNENPFGPSPAAKAAYAAAAGDLAIYPDGGALALRTAIAAAHGIDAARVICGSGSDELLSLLCQAYAGPGDEVVHSAHGFAMYSISARAAGATPVAAPERDLTTDVDALLAACGPRTRLVFVANPNNPTGTMIGRAELERLADGLPERALLVVDGAYAEYVDDPDYEDGFALVAARDNVVTTRTFSKIHGLAALRLGWAYCPAHVAAVLDRVRGPFNVSAPALAAGAAAIADAAYVAQCREENARLRADLRAALAASGVESTESHGNFLLAHFGEGRAAEADAFLKSRGLIIRRMEGYGLPAWLRISIGDAAACAAVAAAVADFAGADR